MIFEAEPDQIARLDGVALVQLMKRLLHAECQKVGVPLRATVVPLQITVPDGGEDGRVEWAGGSESTDYLPARFCIFQSKAQNLTESAVKAEVLKKNASRKPKRGKAKAELNDAIAEVLNRGGAYVMFCARPLPGKQSKLRKAIQDAIRQAGAKPSKATAIEIYDANKIADWVNTLPSVALWLTSQERKRSLSGFQSHEGWGKAAGIAKVPWMSSDAPRFVPANVTVPGTDRLDRSRNAWTFSQAADAALARLADSEEQPEDGRIVRVAGPSGFGKSRFAYELFRRGRTVADEIYRTAVIYADYSIVGDEASKLALEIADAAFPSILVVDDCPDDVHLKLVESVRRVDSCLRLITVNVETRMQQAKGTLVITLEPAPDELIGGIARGIAPKLHDQDAKFIQELSNGFPSMAVLAAQAGSNRREAIGSVDEVMERIVWGKHQHNDEAQRALEFLSLFDWIGLTGPVKEQAAFVAREFAGIAEDTFVECIKSFKPRGIIARRGNFVQIQPIPLAARLAAQRISLLADGKLASFFSSAPQELRMSLLRQLRWLDTSPVAQEFARQLLYQNCLGNFAALNSGFGSECIDRLVHVSPDGVMAALDSMLASLSLDQLRELREGRRHVIWALEKLAFRKQTFERAAILLRKLGAAETEENIGNNASGQFKELYQLHLSGTEAGPEERLRVLDEGLRSTDRSERELCVDALGTMLQTGHFTRGGGAEEIGSGERLEDWRPKTYGDIWNFHRAAMTRLANIATSNDRDAKRALELLGSHIRGLINSMPFADVKAIIERIVAHHGSWYAAIKGLNQWLFYDRRKSPPEAGTEVRAFFDSLLPTDPVELAAMYTRGWQVDFNDPDASFDSENKIGKRFEYATRKSVDLAGVIATDGQLLTRALEKLATSENKTAFPFARRLAELADDPVELFTNALRISEARDEPANRGFFGGLIAGTDERDPEKARVCIRAALRSPKLKDEAIAMIGSGKLQPNDLRLVISLLQSGDVDPLQCATLSYGRGLDHLLPEEIMPFLDELGHHGATGHWAVLNVISMYLLGGKPLSTPVAIKLKSTLLADDLLDHVTDHAMDGYHLDEMTKLLLKHGQVDRKFASGLVKQVLRICQTGDSDIFFALDEPARSVIASLLPSFPNEIWREVSRLLTAKDWNVRFYMQHLLEPGDRNHVGPGLLHSVPRDIYLGWVRKSPAKRAEYVMEWLPVATTEGDGKLTWHPDLVAYVDEFGDQPGVLSALARRMPPKSGWGSLVPHLEPFLPLLEPWAKSHKKAEVRKWTSEQIGRINDAIAANKNLDEEHDVGIY